MNSGNRKRTAAIACLSLMLMLPAHAQTDAKLEALLAKIAQPGPSKTKYTEVRYSRLMKRAVVTSGTLEYRGIDGLKKSVEKPFRETTEVDGENVRVERQGETPRRFGLNRAPELRGVLTSFGALLAGDAATLTKHFTPTLTGDDARWHLTLVPRDAKTRARVATITIDGAGATPACFSMREPDGDASILLVGDTPPALGKDPAQDDVVARCRDGR